MKTIMLVEDQAIIALSESLMLRGRGFRVEVARSGEDAIGLIDEGMIPDLVLMDIDLGAGIDGFEAAKGILSRRYVPIVFLSAQSSEGLAEAARKATGNGYLIKKGDSAMLSSIEAAVGGEAGLPRAGRGRLR